jgi:hypothetical protein
MAKSVLGLVLVAGLCAYGSQARRPIDDSAEDEDMDWTAEYSTTVNNDELDILGEDWRGGLSPGRSKAEDSDEVGMGDYREQNLSETRPTGSGSGWDDATGGNEGNAGSDAEATAPTHWHELAVDPSRWLELTILLARSWYFLAAVFSYCWHCGHIEIAFLSLVNGLLSFFVWVLGLEGQDPKSDKFKKESKKRKHEGQRKKGKAVTRPTSTKPATFKAA